MASLSIAAACASLAARLMRSFERQTYSQSNDWEMLSALTSLHMAGGIIAAFPITAKGAYGHVPLMSFLCDVAC